MSASGRGRPALVTAAAALGVVVVAGLAGCSGEQPAATPSARTPTATGPVTGSAAGSATSSAAGPGTSSGTGSASVTTSVPGGGWGHPALLEAQVVRIDEIADAALAAAVQKSDATAVGGRLVGPARSLLAADLVIAAGRKSAAPTPTRLAASRVVVPEAGPWPRWFITAGNAPARPTPVVRVLVSPTAREPYGVWAELALLPGATLPQTIAGERGAEVLTADASGLVMTPANVALRYADLLNRGSASAFAAAFAPDAFRTQLGERLAGDRKQIVSSAVATITSTHAPVTTSTRAVRTADGGALVVAELHHSYLVTVEAGGGVVRPDAELAALAGRSQFTRTLRREAVEVLAFTVPRAGGANATVRLIAAVKGDVSATGS